MLITENDFIKEGYKSKIHYFSELSKNTNLSLKIIRELSKTLENEEFYFDLMEENLFNEVFQELIQGEN